MKYENSLYWNPNELRLKAKSYKKIGRIGGVVLGAIGLVPIIYGVVSYDCLYITGLIGAPIIASGLIWWGAWTIASNNALKKARIAELSSNTIISLEVLGYGQNTQLFAGIDLLTNAAINERTFGLGLKLKF